MSHPKPHLEPLMRKFIEEAESWDLEPKTANLHWTSIHMEEKKEDTMIEKGPHTFPFEKSFKILGYIFNPVEKMQDILDAECKQSMV